MLLIDAKFNVRKNVESMNSQATRPTSMRTKKKIELSKFEKKKH